MDKQKLTDQIETWFNRAAMALQQGNLDLSDQALQRRWEFEKQLAVLEGRPEPDPPPKADEFFRGWSDRDPRKPRRGPSDGPLGPPGSGPDDSPAPVPKHPYPSTGAGAIALPLPQEDSDQTS